MALQPLRNPLLRFDALPTAMSLRKNPDNSVTWDVTQQYYVGDVVISPDDGGAAVLKGVGATTAEAVTTLLGGLDPAEDAVTATPSWVATGPIGVGWSNYDALAPPTATAAAGVITLTNNVAVTAGGRWVSVVKFAASGAPAYDGTQFVSVTCTPNGTGAVGASVLVAPVVAAGPNTLSVSTVWDVPADGTATTLTLASSTSGAWATTVISGLTWTLYRIF